MNKFAIPAFAHDPQPPTTIVQAQEHSPADLRSLDFCILNTPGTIVHPSTQTHTHVRTQGVYLPSGRPQGVWAGPHAVSAVAIDDTLTNIASK